MEAMEKIVKAAVKKDILRKNPCEDIVCKADEEALKKDILSIEEMQQLIATTYKRAEPRNKAGFYLYLVHRHKIL